MAECDSPCAPSKETHSRESVNLLSCGLPKTPNFRFSHLLAAYRAEKESRLPFGMQFALLTTEYA